VHFLRHLYEIHSKIHGDENKLKLLDFGKRRELRKEIYLSVKDNQESNWKESSQ